MKRKGLYHRAVSICIILGGVAAWNVFFIPSASAAPVIKLEVQDQDMEFHEQDLELVPEVWKSSGQNDSLYTPDDNSFDSQPQDESVVDDTFQEEEGDVDENLVDEEALDEIEGLENLPDEDLEPSPPAE